MSNLKEVPDSIHLPNISEEQIEQEHLLLTLTESAYDDLVKGFTLRYDIDEDEFDVALGIRGLDDFFELHYLPSIMKCGKYDGLTHEGLNLMNQLTSMENQIILLMEKLENTRAVSDSLGWGELYAECLDRMDSAIDVALMAYQGEQMES